MAADRKLPPSSQAEKAGVSPKMPVCNGPQMVTSPGFYFVVHAEAMLCLGQLRFLAPLWSRGGTPTAQWLAVERKGEARWVEGGGVGLGGQPGLHRETQPQKQQQEEVQEAQLAQKYN